MERVIEGSSDEGIVGNCRLYELILGYRLYVAPIVIVGFILMTVMDYVLL